MIGRWMMYLGVAHDVAEEQEAVRQLAPQQRHLQVVRHLSFDNLIRKEGKSVMCEAGSVAGRAWEVSVARRPGPVVVTATTARRWASSDSHAS